MYDFSEVKVADKYKKAASEWLERWLTEPAFQEYVPQIKFLLEQKKWNFLLDSFYQVIPFGTGGRRGLVGIGPNRINKWTIQASAQGHSQYLLKHHGEKVKRRGVVLAFDVRKYQQKGVYDNKLPNPVMNLDCKDLAKAAAEVYAANGFTVHMFSEPRSTPELSFAIRYMKAVAGDMFSASHNLPTDNGKKVYDEFGGQLIPPFDQELVDEVTAHVTQIKTIAYDEACKSGLIKAIGTDVDEAYIKSVCAISKSKKRDATVLYSPLHGTGITSYYPVMKKLGFTVALDPKTSHQSGAFENVTFNIPNPEVKESFDTLLEAAKGADVLINSDPDADRMGVMVRRGKEYFYLNGNEIGILLTAYGISKMKKGLVIKTDVTSSLIQMIAEEEGCSCIGDLLVGFKYIGEQMNILEKKGKIDKLILGTEESHGFIMGNYSRDKDGAAAAVWISEYASELKQQGKTLVDALDEIYLKFGYCHNYLTEIRLLGAAGMEQIAAIMGYIRDKKVTTIGSWKVTEIIDRWKGSKHLSLTDTASRNVVIFKLEVEKTHGVKVTIRPSGTEPKVKVYIEVFGDVGIAREQVVEIREEIEKEFMKFCYKIISIDFPERGFLLFWQLPLSDKMKYFEIEDEIARLKNVKGKEKLEKLNMLLTFLGANPVKKIDLAFKARFGKGVMEYLGL